jgi:anthranilate synthase
MTGKMIDGTIETYVTDGGVTVSRSRHKVPYEGAMEPYIDGLDTRRGAVFSSNYEYPGRYTRCGADWYDCACAFPNGGSTDY